MKLIQKEKLISSTYGASTNTPFAEPRPLLGKRPSPQERDTHRRAHGRLENRKGAWKVLLGTRAARLLPLPSPHDLLSDDHNHRGSLSTMRVPRSPDPEVGPENLYLQQVSPDHPCRFGKHTPAPPSQLEGLAFFLPLGPLPGPPGVPKPPMPQAESPALEMRAQALTQGYRKF